MLTEDLLIEWTGFYREYLVEFYIEFRKENNVDINNLFTLKQSVLNFLKIYNKRKFREKIQFFNGNNA
jgi:hypothetical protein